MLFMFDAMRSFQSRVVQKCPMAAAFKGAGWVRLSGSLGQRRRVHAKSYCIMIHTGRKARGCRADQIVECLAQRSQLQRTSQDLRSR